MFRWTLALSILVSSAAAFGQSADVGLVNLVSGDVSFAPSTGAAGKLLAYMKLRDGDRINLSAGAQLRVVYFQGARQEFWTGPASFKVGKASSEAVSGYPKEVATLPASAPQRLARVPELMQQARLGGIQVRGMSRTQKASLDQQAAVSEARTTYAQMRGSAPADDITPELFLYSALHEYLLYDEMSKIVDEMLRRQPGNEDVKALSAWVKTRASK